MVEFVVFCLPGLVYVLVQSRGEHRTLRSALERLGASWGSASAYRWAALLLLPLLLTGWLAIVLIPEEALAAPGVTVARVTSVGVAASVVLRAVGEEVLFRGLLGGIFVRRLGFAVGNLVQATLFVLPHSALLLIDVRLWPIIPVQFAAGWMLGWLREKTGTFGPGAVVHVVANLAAGFIAG
ncbi:CPBP family intramembrane glutamic endopeptidase [Pseudoclavibacter sp. RFBA6]|uniref:CPBP family intramembrane glutamic endopeptidase n=1 Tax=Pseudoclavibacter sp. RFBA6 TaxID=2080573 RepID=UPI000CE724A4|nr:CPBP family intramembrane glutamic endopeptidase [Pseudoclavibacter sp. RFBA6]PPG38038.1 CPBP family intramembrane metalloprotease [Pseudoclavibacter sp. RFBA6]